MREQSHIDAMRAAVKGDLERARSRNPSIFEHPASSPAVAEPEPTPEPVVAVEPEPVAAPDPEPVAAVEPEPARQPDPEPTVEPEPGPKPGLLARLAFWR